MQNIYLLPASEVLSKPPFLDIHPDGIFYTFPDPLGEQGRANASMFPLFGFWRHYEDFAQLAGKVRVPPVAQGLLKAMEVCFIFY